MSTKRIKVLLETHKTLVLKKIVDTMDKAWGAWSDQASELHIFWANQENRRKEGKGFYKVNEDSVTSIREELANDYRSLAQLNSTILEEFTDDQLQLALELEARGRPGTKTRCRRNLWLAG